MRSPLVALCVLLWVPGAAFAAFEDLGAGARAIGMGNAFSALADDAGAAYYGPAGLAGLPGPNLVSSYGRLHLGLDDGSALSSGYIGYAQPLGGSRGTLGASVGSFSLSGWYQEQVLRLSYARAVRPGLSAGLNLKYLRVKVGQDEYTAQDPVFSNGSKDSVGAVSADLSAAYQASPKLRLALMLQDVNQPDMGFGSKARVPLGLRAGAAYPGEAMDIAVDLLRRDGETRFHTGLERWLSDRRFAVRGGLGLGTGQFANLSVGLGVAEKRFRVDYAFLYPLAGLSATMGTHQFGLTLSFGPPLVEPAPPQAASNDAVPAVAPVVSSVIPPAIPPSPRPKPKVVAPQPQAPRFPLRHVVAAGDSLRSLAGKYYGDPGKWVEIYKANRGSIGPEGELAPGGSLLIPEASR